MEQKLVNINKIREDFPILKTKVNGKPLIYFDNAATSQKPIKVIKAINEFYENYNANVHRGISTLSQIASEKYEEARIKIARFINAKSKEIIFVRNATEGLNIIAQTYARQKLKENDVIILTEMEHHSNIVPWQIVAREKNLKLVFIPITREGALDLKNLDSLLKKAKLISLTQVSNVLGVINPIKEIIKKAHENNVIVVIDAAASAPHLKIDVKDLDVDFLAFSSHKMLGPTGVGVLYAKKELFDSLEPLFSGGGAIKEVTLEKTTYADVPERFEAGTPNIADVIAFGSAVDYINGIGIEIIKEYEKELTKYALEKLRGIKGIKMYGPLNEKQKIGIISFNLADIHPHDLNSILDEEGIIVRSGHHCCQPLMHKLGIQGTVRISFSIYNTKEEIDFLIKALERAKKVFRV